MIGNVVKRPNVGSNVDKIVLNRNMPKFKIYARDKEFHLTDNKLFLSQMILLLPGLIHTIFFKSKEFSSVEIWVLWLFLISMVFSILLNLSSHLRYRPLEGKIENEIELSENEIIIGKNTLDVESIESIEITNDDFLDFVEPYDRYVRLGRKSHGIDNQIRILMKNATKYKVSYQQDQNHDMQECKELLKLYYSKGIITQENLMYVLGIVDEEEKREFTKTLDT